MTKGYVTIADGQVSYQECGNGTPLLLLHQTPFSYEEYSLMIPFLAKRYRVIAMETPGYGYSDNPPRKYEVEDYTKSIIRFLDALKIDKTSIVGHHTGAVFGVELASSYPDRVDKLVASGLPIWNPQQWAQFRSELANKIRLSQDDGLFLVDLWKTLKSYSCGLTAEQMLKSTAIFIDGMTRKYNAQPSVAQYDVRGHLPLIKSKTLVISGRKDMFINDLKTIKRLMPRCKTKVIEGAGAYLCLEKPEEFANVILEFLGEV